VSVAVLFLIFLGGETVADQQQWSFQQEKARRRAAQEPLTGDYRDGFLQSGLFRYSRHPNFFCELSIWWVGEDGSLMPSTSSSPAPPPHLLGACPGFSWFIDAVEEKHSVLGASSESKNIHLNSFGYALRWVFYLFTYSGGEGPAPAPTVYWNAAGPLLLTLLFLGSTDLTEKLSARKYPEYKLYQARTSMLVPLPAGRRQGKKSDD
jgi:steroid 5-alpha reductase family enzyme